MSSDHMPLGPYALQPKKQRFFRFLIDESLLSNIPSQLNLDTFRRVGYGRIQSIAKEIRKQVCKRGHNGFGEYGCVFQAIAKANP